MINIRQTDKGVLIPVKVTPRGGKNCVLPYTEGDEWLKVKVTAPPEDGKANEAVIQLLSKVLGMPKRDITIASGESSRMKQVAIEGISATDARLVRLVNSA